MQDTFTAKQEAYQVAAEVADDLLQKRLPLVGFNASDDGRQVAFLFSPATNGWFERYVCKLPTAGLTTEAVEAKFNELCPDG